MANEDMRQVRNAKSSGPDFRGHVTLQVKGSFLIEQQSFYTEIKMVTP